MPLYEYQCESCQHRFEKIHAKFSDPPIATCPVCGGPVRKLISSPAIQFKGSGWYITDYAKKSKDDSSSRAEKERKADSGADSGGKTDSAAKSGDAPASTDKPPAKSE